MPKKGIHPTLHDIEVVHTNGTRRTLKMAWGEPGTVLTLDLDRYNQPAWTKQDSLVDRTGELRRFRNRFGTLGLAMPGSEPKKV